MKSPLSSPFNRTRAAYALLVALALLEAKVAAGERMPVRAMSGLAESASGDDAVLRARVPHVVFLAAYEQVSGIAARRIVAAVADVRSIGNRAVRQYPSETMRADLALRLVGLVADVHRSVTAFGFGAEPRPAIVWLATVNLSPELFGERDANGEHAVSIPPFVAL